MISGNIVMLTAGVLWKKTEESVKLGPINSKIVLLDPLYKSIQCKLHGSSTCP